MILRAGRLTQPEGKLTLTMMNGNAAVRDDMLHYVHAERCVRLCNIRVH